MIRINIVFAIAAYLCFFIFFVFVLWIFYNYREQNIFSESEHIQQCSYCTHVFFNYTDSDVQTCPRCKSYVKTQRKYYVETVKK